MTPLALDKVEVYLFRRRSGSVQFLALRRSPGRSLAGVWQPVTGKVEKGESFLAAAARELWEETGIRTDRWWLLECPTIYLDRDRGRLAVLPLLAAQAPRGARIRLSAEHDRARFVSGRAAAGLFLWDSQRLGLEAVKRQVLRAGPLERALRVASSSMRERLPKRSPGSRRARNRRQDRD